MIFRVTHYHDVRHFVCVLRIEWRETSTLRHTTIQFVKRVQIMTLKMM